MKRSLFYGSLKRGEFNFDRFGAGTQKFIKTVEIDGFNLYNLGAYPGITKGEGKLVAELHEVDDEAYMCIERMEIGAGYTEGFVEIDGERASIFFYEGRLNDKQLIKDGNWKSP